jgi:hypothetical protein
MEVVIRKSKKPNKKFDAIIDDKKVVSFGDSNYSDMTLHKNPHRKDLYINRHRSREDWTKTGLETPGFYSRWVLWNKPSLKQSIDVLNDKYKNIKFTLKQ